MADYRLHQTGDEVQRILDNATPQSDLTAETERAQQAENLLQQNINNEQSARQQADITLQQHIDAEAQTRQQADAALNQLIQQVQTSLINYYLKTETYSANQIDQMLSAIKQFRYQVVDVLPEPSADTMGIIYLVPSAHAVSGNIKDEYITLTRDEGSGIIYYFEQIGETAIDLSNYYTKAQTNAEITNALNTALANYSTTQQMAAAIATAIANYYTKAQVDAMIAPFITASVNNLVNYYLKSETFNKTEVQQMIAAVKQFRYQVAAELPTASVDTVGIIYLIPSTNPKTKNVKDEFITIAITEQGSTTYSWEQIGSTEVDLSGYSTTEQMNAAIASAITAALAPYYTAEQVNAAISTALSDYYTSQQTDAAITSALNAALADYSTTQQMNAAIAAAIANYYTKAQVDALIADFITASVNNLVNYYLKSETYSKDEVNQLIGELSSLRFEVADTLPTASASTLGAIYLVPGSSPTVQNIKDEYITLKRTEGGVDTYYWELIGSTAVDLSNYYTKAQTNEAITAALNAALADYSTTQQMNAAIAAAIAGYYTKQEVDALIADFITASVNNLVNYYLKSDTYTKSEVQQLIAAVKQFTYQSVATLPTASADTMNIIYLVPSSDPQTQNVKDEYITIATTDQDVTTYAWEKIGSTDIDLSGYYTSTQTDNAISTALQSYSTTTQMNAAITAALNTALADYSTTQQMNAAIATAIAGYYTKQEVDALIANFITKSVDDLVNYYLKSDTYTKTEVQQLIAAVKQFTYQSVATLPTASADTMNIIYLVPSSDPKTQNIKDEYITIATTEQDVTTYAWEKIGSTDIDLSGYYTSTQTDNAISTALQSYSTTTQMNAAITAALNTALADYSTSQQMNAAIATAIAGYYTKQEVDALIANFITKSVDDLVNYYLKSDTYTKAEVQQLIAAVKQFTYQSVATLPTASADTMNIIYLVPSDDPKTQNVKDEYITIATTEQDVTTYAWEKIGSTDIDLSGYYTSAQTDAAIGTALQSYSTTTQMNTAITTALNTALADYSTTQQMTASIATAIANYYTKQEVDALIANFITKSVDDLVNYYLKSDTYTKAEVQQLIAAIKQFTYQSVATLPTASADTMNIIYLVPSSDPKTQNVKDEYITIATTEQDVTTYAWEKIGSTEIDLSGYYTSAQTDAAISAALNTALASYYNKTEIDDANQSLYNTLHGEVQAVNARIDTLFNADYVGFSVRLSDTTKVMNMIGTAEQLAAFDDWVDNSPKPCEVKKDGTDFAYLTNTAGVASSTSWLTREDGTPSKYSTQDKNYLQMVELENVNISVETTGTQLRVMFNFSPVCPEGFHRMFAEPTKLVGRYDLTFNSDGSTLDCCNGTSQPSGTFSFDNLHSMLNATGTDLLGWTAWEISCFAWIQAMRFRTLDVPSSARGKGLQTGSEAAARGWVNGTTDSLTTPHGGVDQNGNGGYRFMYIENCTDGKQWLIGFGWHGNNGKGYFTRDDYKANAQALIPILECEAEHDYPTNLSETYAKNVSELGIATEGGGSASSGFFDGNWSNTSDDRIFYAGGGSYYGALCGPFARGVDDDASFAHWHHRGRVALRKSEVSA